MQDGVNGGSTGLEALGFHGRSRQADRRRNGKYDGEYKSKQAE